MLLFFVISILVVMLLVVTYFYLTIAVQYRILKKKNAEEVRNKEISAHMFVETVTEKKNVYDVEFTEKGVYIVHHGDIKHVIISEISLASAASTLVSICLHDEP